MITPEYCRTMAQYNQWQNNGLRALVKSMDEDVLRQERGAFFGSLFGTMNHLLWGDIMWLNRFGAGDPPAVPPSEHRDLTPNKTEWDRLRFLTDGQIMTWAGGLKSVDLTGDLAWHSSIANVTMHTPIGLCATHFFNHQTHHRGQIHAMMTAAGQKPIDTDLPLMLET